MFANSKRKEQKEKSQVPLWLLILALALAGLGWTTATFFLGRTTASGAPTAE